LRRWFTGEPASGPRVSAAAAAASAAASLSAAAADTQLQQDTESAKKQSLAAVSLQKKVSASVGFDIGSAILIEDEDIIDGDVENPIAPDAMLDASAQPLVLSASTLVAFPYPPIEEDFNASLRCRHDLVDPLKLHAMKRVSPACWQAIRADGYSAATELSHYSLCVECVTALNESANRIDAEKQHRLDLVSELDASKDLASGFVVSKKFIQLWKAEVKKVKSDFTKLPAQINQDILCDCSAGLGGHGANEPLPALSAKLGPVDFKASARFVSADLWARLCRSNERFFNSVSVQSLDSNAVAPPCAVAPAQGAAKKRKISASSSSSSSSAAAKKSGVAVDADDDIFCVTCRAKNNEDVEARCIVNNSRDEEKHLVAIHSSSFADQFPPAEIKMGTYCIIPQSWFQRWSSFIQHGSGRRPGDPSDFDDKLLCEHKKLCYAPWPINSQVSYCGDDSLGTMLHCDAGEIRLLQQKEFRKLQSLYPELGEPIEVVFSRKQRNSRGSRSLSLVAWCGIDVITTPAICVDCAAQRMQIKIDQSLHFECGTIKLVPGSICSTEVASSSTSSTSSASSASTSRSRSTRTKKGTSNVDGICCNLTVAKLKMRMLALDIGANIEHVNHIVLHYNGVVLDNDGKTLFDYRIPTGAKVEFAIDTQRFFHDCQDFCSSTARAPERGFADTNFFKS
jgi:hypothetical protein